jgi:hypothetical protein
MVSFLASSALKMEATYSSETSVDFRRATLHYILENRTLQMLEYKKTSNHGICGIVQSIPEVKRCYHEVEYRLLTSLFKLVTWALSEFFSVGGGWNSQIIWF